MYATDRQNAFIISLVNRLTGKTFRFASQAPRTISRLSDGLVSEHECKFGISIAQASALIDVLKTKTAEQTAN